MIAVCPNPYRDIDLRLTKEIVELFASENYETCVCPLFGENDPKVIPGDIEVKNLSDMAGDCTMAVVIGGDGTILSAVRAMRDCMIPIVGVNLGTMGFMSTLEVRDVPLLLKAAEHEMKISRRMMLDVEIQRRGEVIFSDTALNDVTIHGHGDCIEVTAWCEGDRITSYSGDGIIIATPTGSTGYSMSAGGPIVEPSASNIIISPICAHTMSARAFVVSPHREIRVLAQKFHGRRPYLSVDGICTTDLENSDIIVCRKSFNHALMADVGIKSFYDIAYEKLT